MKNKFIELRNSYWNGTGAYQSKYENLYSELVLLEGEVDTLNGELLKSISRIFLQNPIGFPLVFFRYSKKFYS